MWSNCVNAMKAGGFSEYVWALLNFSIASAFNREPSASAMNGFWPRGGVLGAVCASSCGCDARLGLWVVAVENFGKSTYLSTN
jgi:hypothetical protein